MDLSATIHLLGETLGETVRTQESVALFETEERIRALAKARRSDDNSAADRLAAEVAALSDEAARSTASAFAVYFDLVNLAEEVHRIEALRERERARAGRRPGACIGQRTPGAVRRRRRARTVRKRVENCERWWSASAPVGSGSRPGALRVATRPGVGDRHLTPRPVAR
jgi:phosphoenolpyruvate carboxylase